MAEMAIYTRTDGLLEPRSDKAVEWVGSHNPGTMTRRVNDCYRGCGRRALYRMIAIVPALDAGGVERSHRVKQSCPLHPDSMTLTKKGGEGYCRGVGEQKVGYTGFHRGKN